MSKRLSSGSFWKYLLGASGSLGILGVGMMMAGHQSTLACGTYIADRWSLPLFTLGLTGALLSLGLLSIALFASPQTASKIGQNLILAGFSLGITVLLINLGMKVTEPPRRQDRMRYDAHDTLGYFTGSNLKFEYFSKYNEFRQTFNTDEQGLIRASRPTRQGVSDIDTMFIGDSFVAGWQVAPDENMSYLFAEELGDLSDLRVSSVNLGVNGYSPIHYRLVYEQFQAQVQPDLVVVVVFVGNDFGDTASHLQAGKVVVDDGGRVIALRSEERPDTAIFNPWASITDAAGHPYLVPPVFWQRGLLVVGHTLIYKPLCQSLEWQRTGPATYDFHTPAQLDPVKVISTNQCASQTGSLCTAYPIRNDTPLTQNYDAIFKDAYTAADQAIIDYSLEQLRQLAAEVRENGQTLVIAIMPDGNQIPNQAVGVKPHRGMQPDELIDSTAPQDLLLAFCEAESLHCLDLLPEFQQHSDEQLYWVYDTHLTAHGQALAGEAIASFVHEEAILDISR